MAKKAKRGVISGWFKTGSVRRRALRAGAPPSIAVQYDRLDRLQQLDPFPPEGLGVRTRLAACWHLLDRLASRGATVDELNDAITTIDVVEAEIRLWRGPELMTTGRHGVGA